MADTRKHRGPDHADDVLFSEKMLGRLRDGVRDLSWLLGRGYAEPSAMKLVGDRYQLKRRQREALRRAACAEADRASREARRVAPADVRGRVLWVDGFNVLITIEAALSDAVLLVCRDGCLRDIASIHGTYRQVQETREAVTILGEVIQQMAPASVRLYLDRPVSNSGRLRNLMESMARERGWPWEVHLVQDPDPVLAGVQGIVATSDGPVLDGCSSWLNLARTAVQERLPGAWFLDLG